MKKRTFFTSAHAWSMVIGFASLLLVSCEKEPQQPEPKSFTPIFIEPIGNNKALVADQYSKELHLLNTESNRIENSFPISTIGGAMATSGNHLFVASYTAEYDASGWPIAGTEKSPIVVFDTQKMSEVKVIDNVFNSSLGLCKMCVDSHNHVWTLTSAGLKRINAASLTIDVTQPLPSGYAPLYASSLEISTDRSTLYTILNNGTKNTLFSFNITAQTFTEIKELKGISPFGFYGLGWSDNNNLLVCDVVNFQGVRGKVIEYALSGDSITHFTVGVAPSAIVRPAQGTNGRFVVINQGTFTQSNASLSLVKSDNTVVNDLFSTTNHRPLGDVAQSATWLNDKWFICISNSRKIEVTDRDFNSLTTIITK